MNRFGLVLLSVVATFLSWGLYGPVLHEGQHDMARSLLRPFICVGIAYFVVAVVVPTIILRSKGEDGRWTAKGLFWSLVAGAMGAIGALGIVTAFKFKGRPVYVMPLVFGLAPVVNTFVTMYLTKTTKKVSWLFIVSVFAVALGAAGVLVFKPKPMVAALPSAESKSEDAHSSSDAAVKETSQQAVQPESMPFPQLLAVIASIGCTALCWGSYGPTLHRGQGAMEGSRLRPLICVGMAYFLVAVLIPFAILGSYGESGHWSASGSIWSLAAGTLGAIGALGVIMAFTFGGKPIYVMPLIFGGAPVINTAASVVSGWLHHGSIGDFRIEFLICLIVVAVGAVCVLVFAPRSGPPKPMPGPATLPPLPGDAPSSDEEESNEQESRSAEMTSEETVAESSNTDESHD